MIGQTEIPAQYLRLARETPWGELAWQYPTILELVRALAECGFGILGGEVMSDEGGKPGYYHGSMYCGNWYLDWKPGEQSWTEYVAESVAVTVRYIEAYVRRNDKSFWYALTFADEQTCMSLREH